jgi:hypothetical protein
MADQNEHDESIPSWEELAAETDRIFSMLDPAGEREYDIRNASFEEYIAFFALLESAPVASHIKPLLDPVSLIQFYNELHPQQAAGYPISRTDVVVECEAVNILCHVLAV